MEITLQLILDYLASRDPQFAAQMIDKMDALLGSGLLLPNDAEGLQESRSHLAGMHSDNAGQVH
jgi:hypothetical protein